MNKNNFYFSISRYNRENNNDDCFDSNDSNEDFSLDKNDSINNDDYSSNQEINFANLNPKINSYEEQIEEKFKNNFVKRQNEKEISFLKQKRINDSNIEENQDANKIKIISNTEKIEQKTTREATGKSNKIKPKKKYKPLFKVDRKEYRKDKLMSKLKVKCFSNHATDKLNFYLKFCRFPKSLNKTKIYKPNSLAFTSNVTYKKNKEFLSTPLRDIFSMKNGDQHLQEKNRLNFIKIFNSRNEAGNIQAYDKFVEYLNMTAEEIVIEFYNSDEFKKFKTNKEIIEMDKAFFQEKKFSLLEDFGFLKLIRGQLKM